MIPAAPSTRYILPPLFPFFLHIFSPFAGFLWYNSRRADMIPGTARQMRKLRLLPSPWPNTTARFALVVS